MAHKAPSDLRIQRINLCVADLDRALRLYQDVLGFSVTFIKDSLPNSYSYPLFGVPEGSLKRFAVLSTADAPRCLALSEVADLPPLSPPRRTALVVHTDALDEAIAGARELSLHLFPEEALTTQDGRTGREIGLLDADGNLVLLYHITE